MTEHKFTNPVPIDAMYSLIYELAASSELYGSALDDLLCCADAAGDAGLAELSVVELLWLYGGG